MKQVFILLLSIAIISCGDDDDYGSSLNYTICGDEIVPAADRVDEVQLAVADWPAQVRTYIAAEFPGFSIDNITTFRNSNGTSFFLANMSNSGVLLFDGQGVFICGDDSFSKGSGGDDDDDDYDDDSEYITYDELPQSIKDYITANYANLEIDEIEFEDGKYEVEFTNDLEICFNEEGEFLGEC